MLNLLIVNYCVLYYNEFMKNLKKLRLTNNYSYKDMAFFLDISRSYYWQLENNKSRLYYDIAVRIAEIFKLKPDDIFYNEKDD